jgi:hypothetical protein
LKNTLNTKETLMLKAEPKVTTQMKKKVKVMAMVAKEFNVLNNDFQLSIL